jgi:hypothetical protein
MGQIIRVPNGNAIYLTPRSASHSIAAACLQSFWPELYAHYLSAEPQLHPAAYLQSTEGWKYQADFAIVLRNPIARFRSMCAHRPNISIDDQLASPFYGPLTLPESANVFLFETQLQDCADWLGITVPLPQIDATEEADKPVLTPEQEARVREIYAADIALWESLQ